MRTLAALLLLSTSAWAADIPTKAAPALSGYPYTASGFYFGLNSIGGAGSADVQAVGLNPNSVTTTQGAIGGTLGYTWALGPGAFAACEAMFDVANFNGAAPGLSFGGPAAFEQRCKLGTPLSNFLSLFPTLNLPTVPPFPPLANGQVANNIHTYLMGGVHEDDVSLAYLQATGKQWQISPSIGVGMMGQLTNGVAIDVWSEVQFSSSSVCVGPAACVKSGNKYLVGLGIYY